MIDEHVLAAQRLHGDDTTVPVLARSKTITQPPAPFHPIARGRAGPNLLAVDAVRRPWRPSSVSTCR